MAKKKYYVVWRGWETGVFNNWQACQEAISGYSQAQYLGFTTQKEANWAFEIGFEEYTNTRQR
jgi:ribonuclease HI